MGLPDIGERIVAFLSGGESAAGLAVLFVSAAVEYVFPPFPGDTITLFGAFLAANLGWSVPLVFVAVTAGSLAGASIDYALGRRLARTPAASLSGRAKKARERVEPILERFRCHGAAYIMVNRFLPGVRALFFVAAGMAGLPAGRVLLYGFVSAAAWNALVIATGFAVGRSWERLLGLLGTYTAVAWIPVVVLVIAVLWIVFRPKRG
ncbi:MAG: DedA family protein [Deltaproteobacteria bacterium]|nr:DedA family protein [Deltaproteobacteria bacterium]